MNDRCPYCGRYLSPTASGWFDLLDRTSETAQVEQFCSAACADRYHERAERNHCIA